MCYMHIIFHMIPLVSYDVSYIGIYFLYRTQMISEAFTKTIFFQINNYAHRYSMIYDIYNLVYISYFVAQYLPYRIEWGNGAINIKTIQINLNTIYDHRIKS